MMSIPMTRPGIPHSFLTASAIFVTRPVTQNKINKTENT